MFKDGGALSVQPRDGGLMDDRPWECVLCYIAHGVSLYSVRRVSMEVVCIDKLSS